jgi:hypothetical protein
VPQGAYTLPGIVSGSAAVQITENSLHTGIWKVHVRYKDYSDDGTTTLNGYEKVSGSSPAITARVNWDSYIVQRDEGLHIFNYKYTNVGGVHLKINLADPIFTATGALKTLVNGVLYTQPDNGT